MKLKTHTIYREDGTPVKVTIPEKNRCFTFSHEQIDFIASALYMASGEYARQFEQVCKRFPDEIERNKYWHEKSGTFWDLAEDIKNGHFDI